MIIVQSSNLNCLCKTQNAGEMQIGKKHELIHQERKKERKGVVGGH